MPPRKYYSLRTGKHKESTELSLQLLKELFFTIFRTYRDKQYFDEAFGYHCVDHGYISGKLDRPVDLYFFQALRKPKLWPIQDALENYTEEDLFDVIEILHDLISKPVNGTYHNWMDCGMHYDTFDPESGQTEFRAEINDILGDYKNGYELSKNGEVLEKGKKGLENLLIAKLPKTTKKDINEILEHAILLFRRHHSSIADRRNAVRMLADIFEELRPKLQKAITKKDENDLFQIANQFGIRHRNDQQKTNYDQSLWLSWMFYYYLATIHLAIRKLDELTKGKFATQP